MAIPLATAARRLGLATTLSGLVLIECAILAVNRCRCPLTGWARRYSADRAEKFRHLSACLAGAIQQDHLRCPFALGELYLSGTWWLSRS
jgi:hypothetical protein